MYIGNIQKGRPGHPKMDFQIIKQQLKIHPGAPPGAEGSWVTPPPVGKNTFGTQIC